MASAFVLVDAVPGMHERVFASLDKLRGRGLVAKERVKSENFDILVKVEGADDDAIDAFIDTHLRFVSGVGACRRIHDPVREAAPVQAVLRKMA